jgi:phenylpropionate dioxygenase-like ring-hydroxylating dioxygenase large terminal subunit
VPYLRNCWYLAAWSEELAHASALGRTYLDTAVALFRDESGVAAAVEDRCSHRFAPLAAGKVVKGALQCPYHGLRFNAQGQCAHNPYGPALRAMGIRSFPLVERSRALWIWMGEAKDADPALVPALDYFESVPDSAFSAGYLHGKAHYELLSDNILDLTHTEYLHPGTLAAGFVGKVRPTIEETEAGIVLTWFVPDSEPLPLSRKLLPDLGRSDLLMRVEWSAPATMKLTSGTLPLGGAEADGYLNHNLHVMTPETEASAHYFFAATRNYRVEDADLNATIAAARAQIFSTEDLPIIERVYERMGGRDFWELRPVLLRDDEASVLARRRLARAIAAERGTLPPAPPEP